jgi:hypothetical protein
MQTSWLFWLACTISENSLGIFRLNEQICGPALGSYPGSSIAGPTHWRATGLMLQTDILNAPFRALFPQLNGYDMCILAAVAGHHGRPPPSEDTDKSANEALRKGIWLNQQCLDAALFAFETLARLTDARARTGI